MAFLIDDILLAPVKGIIWLAEKIEEQVEKEMNDEGRIKEKLMELQQNFEMDEISQEEYEKQESKLLERLDAIIKSREEIVKNKKEI